MFLGKSWNVFEHLFSMKTKYMFHSMYVLNVIDNSNWKFTRSGQKASLWNWYKWGAWNIQWGGRVRSAHHRLDVKHNLRSLHFPPRPPQMLLHMIVSHRSHRGTSHVVWLNHIRVDHTVFTRNHIYATVANVVPVITCPHFFLHVSYCHSVTLQFHILALQ